MENISEKELNARRMFGSLKRHIGKEVSIMYSINGKMQIKKGILEEVEDFNCVMINGTKIPFIGYGSAIYIISSPSKILYKNEVTEHNFNKKDNQEILAEIGNVFGPRVEGEVAKKLYFDGFVPTEAEEELGEMTREDLEELKEVLAELAKPIKENGKKVIRTVKEATPLSDIDRERLQEIIASLKKPAESLGLDGKKMRELGEALRKTLNPSEEDIANAKAKLEEEKEKIGPLLQKGKEKAGEVFEALKDLSNPTRKR